MTALPILYSFRRCPYAMRARLAIAISGVTTELREVVLRDKPAAMLEISPKATVPVLQDVDGAVLEESRDLMFWALTQNDPENWLAPWREDQTFVEDLFDLADGPFKKHLDRYKYPSRYPDENIVREEQRDHGMRIIKDWNQLLSKTGWLWGDKLSIADMAVLPFLRQYAHVDKVWFDQQDIPHIHKWLGKFLSSELFLSIMHKYPQWHEGDQETFFPAAA